MVRYCVAALLMVLAWLAPATAWASPLLAQTAEAEAEVAAEVALTPDEIATFAKVYQGVQSLRLGAEREMTKAVEDEGLTIDRFNAIAATQLDGPAETPEDMAKVAAKAKISKKETKQFDAVVSRIIAIRQSTEGEMEEAIAADGLSINAFNSILERSADDTDLQRKISDEIVKQTLANAEATK
ncbi:MAG: hypothetical protein DCF17_22120 [Shackletoniella antarctica]|uniref:DUF4168 domain-containing protein n=1 Tax=Shackletoniella antarctica TaxID=268115 RepID=A0A2W4XF83_9CYAN|nr:MAG: hypothetical protein DCF17_22120 [Shackletoniella antarctica]